MKKPSRWILAIYPAITVILIVSTFALFKDWWRISFTGETTEGRIEAVFLLRDDAPNALLSGVETRLKMTRADGEVLQLDYVDDEIVRVVDGGRELSLGEEGVISFTGEEAYDRERTAEFREVLTGKKDRAGWFLLREKRAAQPESIVRLEKRETAMLWEGLPETFDQFVFNEATGRVLPADEVAGNLTISELVTEAIFSYEDEAALEERKGEMLVSYTRTLDGEELVEELNKEFVIFNEPYWTIKYPIFVFQSNGDYHALKADIGRHGDPSLAFPLFAEVKVDYLPGNPQEALMNGKITPRKPGEQFLNWFSRASEVYLTRWIYPGMFLLCAFVLIVVSVLFISMMTHPPKKLPPVPENKEKEGEGELK